MKHKHKTKLEDHFKALRLEKDMTQVEFARLLRISQGTVSKIETGHLLPTIYILKQICNIYGPKKMVTLVMARS